MILVIGLWMALMRYEAAEPCMGTLARVVVYSETEEQADAAMKTAFARMREIEGKLSDYRPGSELNAIGAVPRKASEDLWRVVEFAQRLAEASGGAFDITLGNRTRAWREGRPAAGPYGWRALRMNTAAREVWLDNPGIKLDAGGIAKGYAAQQALAAVAARGVHRALVAIGGDIAAGEPPPGEVGWKVRIPARDEPLLLRNAAVSTSGDTEQFKAAGSHIHDGRAGDPLPRGNTVSVVAPDGMAADALATAVRVLGREAGASLAAKFGATVY